MLPKSIHIASLMALASVATMTTENVHAQRTNNDRRAAGNPAIIIEGSTFIGGCNTGIRRVEGNYYCPPDNPDGGRTPPGYFWNPSSTLGSAMGQTANPNRTGAFIRIVQSGQHCEGNNLIVSYNNGTVTNLGFNTSCAIQVASSGGGDTGLNADGPEATGSLTDGFGGTVSDGGGAAVGAGDAGGPE